MAETTDHGLFEFKNKDEEGKPIKEETLASEFDEKILDEEENKQDGIAQIPRSYNSSSSSSVEENKGLKEKLMEKLPGHKDEVPIEEPHVQEVVYSEPPHTEKDPQKKGFHDKIKEKLPGQNKTDDHHVDEAVPVVAEPAVEGEEDKKGFLDKIKDKISGLSSSKASEEKNDQVDK